MNSVVKASQHEEAMIPRFHLEVKNKKKQKNKNQETKRRQDISATAEQECLSASHTYHAVGLS